MCNFLFPMQKDAETLLPAKCYLSAIEDGVHCGSAPTGRSRAAFQRYGERICFQDI